MDRPHPDAPDQADPDRIRAVLTRAGFDNVTPTAIDPPLHFGPDAAGAAEFFLGSGPVRAILDQSDRLTTDQARARLRAALQRYERADGVWLSGAYWLVTASASAALGPRP